MYPVIRSLILVCLAICLSGCAPDVEKSSLSDPLPSTAIAVTAYSDWSAPVNLAALNTSAAEAAPALSADGTTMIFNSNRPGGQGGLDLYVSTRTRLN